MCFYAIEAELAWRNTFRKSELAELYPAHVVSAWIGSSVKVAEKHHLMVSADHFAQSNAQSNAVSVRHQ